MTVDNGTVARFWDKVQRRDGDACWEWTARTDRSGYGIFSVTRRALARAHRLSFLLSGGVVPGTGCVLHRCGNHRCVRPDHLYVGSLHALHATRPRRPPSPPREAPAHTVRGDRHWTRRDRGRVPRGEGSNLAKLSENDVREIRRLYESGTLRNAELSAKFGIAERSVYHIVRRKTWAHVV
jgi:hypothetical protein